MHCEGLAARFDRDQLCNIDVTQADDQSMRDSSYRGSNSRSPGSKNSDPGSLAFTVWRSERWRKEEQEG